MPFIKPCQKTLSLRKDKSLSHSARKAFSFENAFDSIGQRSIDEFILETSLNKPLVSNNLFEITEISVIESSIQFARTFSDCSIGRWCGIQNNITHEKRVGYRLNSFGRNASRKASKKAWLKSFNQLEIQTLYTIKRTENIHMRSAEINPNTIQQIPFRMQFSELNVWK